MFMRIIFFIVCQYCGNIFIISVGLDPAQQALEYVFQLSGSNCGAGTDEQLSLQFDVTAWNQYTDPAIRYHTCTRKYQ